MARQYDVVVFGASGFTGQYIALQLAKRSLEQKTTLRWAIAGRSQGKLEDIRMWIENLVPYYKESKIPIVIADVFNTESLNSMCKSANILLNCTGPYLYFGEPVVKSCVEAHTHYLDITGEVQFILEMMVKYNEDAKKSDIVVVSAVGYDSLPSELIVQYAADQFPRDGCMSSAEVFMGVDSKHGHATTYECVVLMSNLDHFKATQRLLKQLDSKPLGSYCGPTLARSLFGFDFRLGLPYFRFLGADTHLVKMTQDRSPSPVQTVVYFYLKSLWLVLPAILFGIILVTLGSFSYGRQLMIKYPRVFTAGFMSKEGPSDEQLKASSFTTHCFASGYSDKTLRNTGGSPDWQVQVKINGPEPGYVATPILMVESAICIWKNEVSERGVVSPGIAFKDTSLIEALGRQVMDVLSWVLLPGMAFFLALSIWAYISLRGELSMNGRNSGLGEASAGSETRKQFFTLLLISAGTRFISLTIDMLAIVISQDSPADDALVSDQTNIYAWMSSIVSLLPSLFFVSTYSLLILFYAQLCTAVYTKSFPYHKGVYVVCNILLYLGFILLMCFCTSSAVFWQWTQGVLGCFYFLGFIAVLYYSFQLIFFFKTSHPDDEFFFDMHLHRGLTPRQIVIQRIMWVCIMCCVLFCGLSVYFLGIATGLIPSIDYKYRTPIGMYPYAFEVCLYIATEFLPCSLLLCFTRRNPMKESPGNQHKHDLEQHNPDGSTSNLRPEEVSYQYQNQPRPYFPRNSSSGVFDRSPAANGSTKVSFT